MGGHSGICSTVAWQPHRPTMPAKSQNNERAGGDECVFAAACNHGVELTRALIYRQMPKVTWILPGFMTFGTE